jgi:hypothetical protein
MNDWNVFLGCGHHLPDDSMSDAGLSDGEVEDYVVNLDGSFTNVVEEDCCSDIGEAEDRDEELRGGDTCSLSAHVLSLLGGLSDKNVATRDAIVDSHHFRGAASGVSKGLAWMASSPAGVLVEELDDPASPTPGRTVAHEGSDSEELEHTVAPTPGHDGAPEGGEDDAIDDGDGGAFGARQTVQFTLVPTETTRFSVDVGPNDDEADDWPAVDFIAPETTSRGQGVRGNSSDDAPTARLAAGRNGNTAAHLLGRPTAFYADQGTTDDSCTARRQRVISYSSVISEMIDSTGSGKKDEVGERPRVLPREVSVEIGM